MEDEYKVVCALSNSAVFDDLEWLRTPVSRSQYSLKANISQTVHPIHSICGSRQGFPRGRFIEWRHFRFDNIQDGGWQPSWNDGAVARNPCVSWDFLFYKTKIRQKLFYLILFSVVLQLCGRLKSYPVFQLLQCNTFSYHCHIHGFNTE